MFTEIVLVVGKNLAIDAPAGDSIAVNGMCLTAFEHGRGYFCADVSRETLSWTTLPTVAIGSRVNLELALTPKTRPGGPISSDCVDGVGMILEKKPGAGHRVNLVVDLLARYLERLMLGSSAVKCTNNVTQELLQQSGFIA